MWCLRLALVARFVVFLAALVPAMANMAGAKPVVIIEPAAYIYGIPVPPAKPLLTLASIKKGKLPKSMRGGRSGLNGRLLGLLNKIERRYGRPVTISSGCRSKVRNRKAGGAKNSYHLRCMAADIKVAGIGEGQLLRYVHSLRGVGGVGSYCGNSVVHVDVGPRRAWTAGCGKRKKR